MKLVPRETGAGLPTFGRVNILLVVVGALLCAQCSRSAAPGEPINKIILMSIDALRADRLGCYGYTKRPNSPHIDAWAKDAVVFDRVYAQAPWTLPSLASLLSGLYAKEVGAYTNSSDMVGEHQTLAEQLKQRGYRTAFFNTNTVLVRKGFQRGFDTFVPAAVPQKIPYAKIEPQVMEWLDTHAGDKFFLWIHDMDTHSPPTEGNTYLQTPGWERYDAEVRWVDEAFGRLLAKLEALGIRDQVLFVFTADHGEAFGEHILSGHQDVIYDEVLNVPLIIQYSGMKHTGHVGALASLLDVHATIAELAGIPATSTHRGESLVPIASGETDHLKRPYVFSARYYFMTDRTDQKTGKVLFQRGQHHLAVHDGQWKLIAKVQGGQDQTKRPDWRPTDTNIVYELYDTVRDPRESTNVVADNAAVANQLQTVLVEWKRMTDVGPEAVKVDLDPAAQEALRALGYQVE